MTDAPGNANAHAFGLAAEEACQLCWYAGINDKLSSAGFYEYNPLYDHRGQTAEMVATMIWYLIEGFYHRKHESLVDETTHVRYTVPFSQTVRCFTDILQKPAFGEVVDGSTQPKTSRQDGRGPLQLPGLRIRYAGRTTPALDQPLCPAGLMAAFILFLLNEIVF